MEIRKYFNRTGVAYFVFGASAMALQFVLALLLKAFLPGLLFRPWVLWILSAVPMYLVGAPICARIMKKLPAQELYRKEIGAGQWFMLFFMSIFLMFCGSIIGKIVSAVISNATGWYTDTGLDSMISSSNMFLVILIVVVIGPFVEELLFRKILIDRLIIFGDKAAILISAIMFGLFHGNFDQFFYAAGVGLILGYIYVRTGKLRYNFLMHMVINLIGGVLPAVIMKGVNIHQLQYSLVTGNISELFSGLGMLALLALYEIMMFGFAVAGIVFMILMRKRFVLKKGEITLTAAEAVKQFVVHPGMLLYLAVCVLMFVLNMMP